MSLWDLYNKFNDIKVWLAGPGADAIGKFIEINDKITDAARQVRDYLDSLDSQGGSARASISVEDAKAIDKIQEVKYELEVLAGVGEGQQRAAGLPPGMRDLLAIVVTELIKKLLEKWGK